MIKILEVEGMSCGHCEMAVKKALNALDGVTDVQVDLGKKEVRLEGEDLNNDKIKEAIEDAGYDLIKIS